MSHFTKLEIKFKDKEALFKAVENLGYQLKRIKNNQPCYRLRGTDNSQLMIQGEYYIPAQSLGSVADVGFKWSASDQAYSVIVDDYFNVRSRNETTKKFRQNLSAEYTKEVAIKQGFKVKNRERLESGEIRYRFAVPQKVVARR
ncbi:UNVERIFIED_CONTAM: hypothetical protein BEN50_20545 [Euhalothece sp. KZN 001]